MASIDFHELKDTLFRTGYILGYNTKKWPFLAVNRRSIELLANSNNATVLDFSAALVIPLNRFDSKLRDRLQKRLQNLHTLVGYAVQTAPNGAVVVKLKKPAEAGLV
jgi:phage regulator Rha-like protein